MKDSQGLVGFQLMPAVTKEQLDAITPASRNTLVEIYLYGKECIELGLVTALCPSFRTTMELLGLSSRGSFAYRMSVLRSMNLVTKEDVVLKTISQKYGIQLTNMPAGYVMTEYGRQAAIALINDGWLTPRQKGEVPMKEPLSEGSESS